MKKKKKQAKQSKWWVIPVVVIALLILASASVNILFPTPAIDLESTGHHPDYKTLPYGTNPGAPVTLVEFVDYQCPYCKEMHPILKKLREEFKSDLNYVYIQAPNQAIHPDAPVAAVAAICAEQRGAIEPYAELLFENQDNLKFDNLQNLAQQIGLNPLEFHECMASSEAQLKLNDDLFEGEVANIRGTPTIFINGARLEGIQEYHNLRAVISAIIEGRQS